MSQARKWIENNPVFAALPAARREALIGEASARRFRRGEIIVHSGDVWPYLFVVTEGSLEALKESSEGRSLAVASFQPGDIFWGLAFFHEGMPMPVQLQASRALEIFVWTRAALVPYLTASGGMAWELSRLMILKMAHASSILEEMTFQPVAGRLARLLLELAPAGKAQPTSRSLTLDEMAARIGSTREMVCRFLHKFADDGIIDITRTEFLVTDSGRLEEMTGGARE